LRRNDAVSSSFIPFRKYPRFRKIDQGGQEFLDPLYGGRGIETMSRVFMNDSVVTPL
jgi:hypothetical protein